MSDTKTVERIHKEYLAVASDLDERGRRRWAATTARSIGWGGVTAVAQATGLSDRTIRTGVRELDDPDALPPDRQRSSGGGRRACEVQQIELVRTLESLLEPTARSGPLSPLRWTCKGTRILAEELAKQGFRLSRGKVAQLLRANGYSLRVTQRVNEKQHAARNQQYEHIAKRVRAFQRAGQPVVWVDTCPVGVRHDAIEFAVTAIRRWWKKLGRQRHPSAKRLLITIDNGGKHKPRPQLWQWGLQELANTTGLKIEHSYFPPATSKWNTIEHRLFCHIARNWHQAQLAPLVIVVNLIGSMNTKQGLEVHAWLDELEPDKQPKKSGEALTRIQLKRSTFHGEWNYEILPDP